MLILIVFGVFAEAMDIWTAGSFDKIYRTTLKPAIPDTIIEMHTAKNEYEGAQILLRNTSSFAINSITFSTLAMGTTGIIAGTNWEYHFVEYYLGYADPLSNNATVTIDANSTQAVWITLFVPSSTEAGKYTGAATINTSVGNFTVPLSATVHNVTVPNGQNAALTLTNWVAGSGFSYRDGYDNPLKFYNIAKYSPQWWSLMDNWAKSFVSHRQNMMLIRTQTLLKDAPGTTIDSNYNITFDWSLFDRYVQLFLDRGITKLEGQPIATHAYTNSYGNRVFDFNRCGVYRFDNDTGTAKKEIWDGDLRSAGNIKWYNQYLPALQAHLVAKGWWNIWMQHAFDEPAGTQGQYDWILLADTLHRYMPGIKVLDALHDPVSKNYLAGHIDLWCVQPQETVYGLDWINARKAAGNDVWLYTTLGTTDPYLNRLASQDLYKGRLLFWLLYKWNISGFLHWGWNAWQHGFGENTAYAGDAYIVYPDSLNGTVKGSSRYENMRDGAEDYELFRILEKEDSAKARAIVNGIITNASTYTVDLELIRRSRINLLCAAAGETLIPLFGSMRIEAEDMALSGYVVENNANASGGKRIMVTSGSGFAEFLFNGTEGRYNIAVAYFEESDGQCRHELYLNQDTISKWQDAAMDDQWHTQTITNVVLSTGTVVKLLGTCDANENSHARIDYVEITSAGGTFTENGFPCNTGAVLDIAPNPFKPSLTIKVNGMLKNAQLSIFDINGCCVADLTCSLRNGSVYPRAIVWNASGHASGVYAVVLKANGKVLKQKALLIR